MRFFLIFALAFGGCSSPEPQTTRASSVGPSAPTANGSTQAPSPTPVAGATVEASARSAPHAGDVAQDHSGEQDADATVAAPGGELVYGFLPGEPVIRDWELGGIGDLSALDSALAARAPLGRLAADGSLSPEIDVERYALVVARGERSFGLLARAQSLGASLELVAEPDAPLHVELEALHGASIADHEVRLVLESKSRPSEVFTASRARANAAGRAALAHAGFALRLAERRNARLRVEVGSKLGPRDSAIVQQLGSAPARLSVEPSSSLVIRVRPEPRSGWPADLGFVLIEPSVREAPPGTLWPNAIRDGIRGPLSARGVRVEGLTPGLELVALCRLGNEFRVARGRVPERAGERADLLLDLSTLSPLFVARALTPLGQPLANAAFEVHRDVPGESFWDEPLPNVHTDRDGRFVLTSTARGATERPELAWHLRAVIDGTPCEAVIAANAWPFERLVEGGELRFVPLPVLVAGRVVDDLGRPIAHARVGATARVPTDAKAELFHRITRVTETGADGSFAFHGRSSASTLSVCALKGERHAEPRACKPGEPIEFVLPRAGALAGALRVPAALREAAMQVAVRPAEEAGAFAVELTPRRLLEASLQQTDDEPELVAGLDSNLRYDFDAAELGRSSRVAQASWDGGGAFVELDAPVATLERKFELDELAPGPARFVVLGASGRELASVPIELRPGETLRDERLQSFDLTPLARTVELAVVSRTGAPLDGLLGLWSSGPGGNPWRRIAFDGARASVQTFEPEVDVFVAAPGHRHARLTSTAASLRLELEPALRIELAIRRDPSKSDDASLPAFGEFQLLDGGDLHPPAGSVASPAFDFGVGERTTIELPCAGLYRVRWFATVAPGHTRIVTASESELEIGLSTAERPLQLDFPAALVRRASRR